MSKETQVQEAAISKKRSKTTFLVGILLVSVLALLVADTLLANWAEASALNHVFQHLLIFAGGVGVGGSLISLRD